MTTYEAFLANKQQIARAVGIARPPALSSRLFPFQDALVQWALRRGKAALFCFTGAGKTVMQLEWARVVHEHTGEPVLIVCPLAVAKQSKAEAQKMLGFDVNICKYAMDWTNGINVINYDRLHLFEHMWIGGVVLDEASSIKAQTGKRRNQIIEAFEKVPFKLSCSATPAPNDYTELGNQAQFLDIMSYAEFLSAWFVHDGGSTADWRLKGHSLAAFWRWVCSWAAVVGSPSDIGFDGAPFVLPPLTTQDVIVSEGLRPSGRLFADNDGMDLQARRKARRASLNDRTAKIAQMVAAEPEEPWLILGDLNDECDALEKAIPGSVNVHGTMDLDDKEAGIDGFVEGRTRVLISKSKIVGLGLNLQHCARVVFAGMSDSYEAYYQAVRRCWRFGQKRPVNVYIVVSDAEMVSVENVRRKGELAEEMAEGVKDLTAEAVRSNIIGGIVTEDEYKTGAVGSKDWDMLLGDCVEGVAKLAEASIDYSIFSPPFESLYTYSASNRDMGNCVSSDEFAEHFTFLVGQLFRVMKPGRLCSFHCMNLPTSKARDGVIGIRDFRGELIRMFTAAGWIYHSEVCIWKDPVTAMHRTKALGLLHKQLKKDSCMSRMGIPDYVVTMRKPGENADRVEHTNESFPVAEWQQYASPIWTDINASDTLQARSARDEADERHICPLQLEVIRRCLRMWTREQDLVLSPFAGIGSEGYEAVKCNRRFLGFELKESYFRQAVANLMVAEGSKRQGNLFPMDGAGD